MKNFNTILLLTLMSGFCLTAQNKDTKKADKQFARYEFVKAAESYNKLVENGKADAYVYGQLAESYYNIFNTEGAERWYAKALETSNKPEMVYKYSQMLKANGKYERCQPQHSWNTNHTYSNLLSFHLQRHSDHHAYPQRPYQVLRDYKNVPTLPTGYGGCFAMAFMPPLWFKVMDKRVMEWSDGDLSKVNIHEPARKRLEARWG